MRCGLRRDRTRLRSATFAPRRRQFFARPGVPMLIQSISPVLPKSPTGIAGFDDLTLGGLPTGRPSLVCGAAGCGKTLFATTFLVNGANRFEESGVFMSFEERAGDLAANVASLGH